MAEEITHSLKNDLLNVWYPLAIDSIYGGFLSDFDHQWKPEGAQNKMIVTQSRHLWTCSKAAQFYPRDTIYRIYARHGFNFLKNIMWDPQSGGFYNLVNQQGTIKANSEGEINKNAYGNAFAIYGLAAYHTMSGDEEALNLAIKAFQWLDRHSHDPVHGGYFQFLQKDGTPRVSGYNKVPPKDQNSTIHLLEAFTELYHAWPDDTLKKRLYELLLLVRDTITTEKGYMNLFFKRDWTPISYRDSIANIREANYHLDHVSFGHDIETAFLLVEAAGALGFKNDQTTLRKAKKMVDHALINGWDKNNGGLYDAGYYFVKDGDLSIIKDSKVWWAQAETLNTLLIMAGLFPNDEAQYFEKFKAQWHYIQTYLIDREYGGWYWGGSDKEPDRKSSAKGTIWKGNYHTFRSMVNCVKLLQSSM